MTPQAATLTTQCNECAYTSSRLLYVKLGPAAIQGAADLSVAYFGGVNAEDRSAYAYLVPSIRYLHYLNPCARRDLYFGGGLGYDLLRTPRLRQFIELDVLQQIVRTYHNSPDLSYTPALSLTFGIGF